MNPPQHPLRTFFLLICACAIACHTQAAELKQARVSQVVNDVKLLPGQAAPRPASINDAVTNGTAVRTGGNSRSELTFTDRTLARLGANTIFSFTEGTRNLDLTDGAMLLRVPKNSGGATISTAAITAAITGTTVMMEFHPGKVTGQTNRGKNRLPQSPAPRVGGFLKFICLEGTARLYLPGHLGESVLVKAGQMVIATPEATSLPNPVDVNLGALMQTSLLITGFPPLGSQTLIAQEQAKQSSEMAAGQLYQTDLVIFGGGTTVSLTDPTKTELVSIANPALAAASATASPTPPPTPTPTPPPTPTPSQYGALEVIALPVPYQINNTTSIATQTPSIATNGTMDTGKIYRGPADDGLPSQYAFGSISAWDTASGFNSLTSNSAWLPTAAFKFQALELAGVPTIDSTNGPANLALIAVDGITTATPGGTWDLPGLQRLLLATQNGSITLGPEITFQNIPFIAIYARGTNADLTLASDFVGGTQTTLLAQRNVSADNDEFSNQSLNIIAGQKISIGVNDPVTITGSEALLLIPNSGAGTIPGDAVITLNPSNGLTLNGANGLSLVIDNSNGGHIAQSADISLSATGLTAGSLNVLINNRNVGMIGSSAQIALSLDGSLNIAGDATIGTSNRNDGIGGGTTTGSAMVNVQASSVSVGGALTSFVTANGGRIGGVGLLVFNVAGDIHSGTGTEFDVQCDAYNGSGGALTPGTIGSDAFLSVGAGSLTSNAFISADIFTNGGGHIQGNAAVSLNTTGDIHAQQQILATIEDTGFSPNGGFGSPSRIDGDATVTMRAQNIITPSTLAGTPGTDTLALEASIYTNAAGTVGGNALVNVSAVQSIGASGDALFWVANGNYQNLGVGTIGGSAGVNVSAANISTGNFSDQILNYGGSTIGGDALVSLSATNLSVHGTFDDRIDNTSGTVGGNAAVVINAATFTATGPQFLQILNSNLASIRGDATIDMTTTNVSTTQLFVAILNNLNDGNPSGTIRGNAVINLNASGTTSVTTNATFQINGSDSAASSAITFDGGTYNVGGTFEGFMDGSGTMTLNNATISADTIKASVFGANGVLRIGGGSLNANTLLHLYAPGSNGIIDFVSNVTLNSAGSAAVIAANAVTIENRVVVTVAGNTPAAVFANVPNYTGSGGNGSTSGTFAGAGATTQPLSQAPPFVRVVKTATVLKESSVAGARTAPRPGVRVTDSSQLEALLRNAAPGRDGKVHLAAELHRHHSLVSGAPVHPPVAGLIPHSPEDRGKAKTVALAPSFRSFSPTP